MSHSRSPSSRPPGSIHADFIKERLPSWAASASPIVLAELRSSLIRNNQSRHDLNELLGQVQNPEMFVRPLFRQALRRYLTGLDPDKTLFVREWRNEHLLGVYSTHDRTSEHSLFEAALQNFEPSEAESGGIEEGSGLFLQTATGRVRAHTPPIIFAQFCRHLDLGSHYQRHLNEFFNPPPLSDALQTVPNPRQVIRAYEQSSFESALHLALLKGEISNELYQQLFTLQIDGQHPDLICNHLTINNVTLPGILVIRDRHFDKSQILYTPHDPVAMFRRYPSMHLLEADLAVRLLSARYLEFFNRFVPLRYRGHLISITPPRIDSLPGGRPTTRVPARVDQAISRTPITGNIFHSIAEHRISHIRSDARVLVVPTADANLRGREARLQRFKELGASILFFAASFIPVVGEVLFTVTGLQLISSVYHGFAAWSRGDSDQALNELLDVMDTVALGLATAGAIKTAGFTATLVKVQLKNRSWRLWSPDLTPYRSPHELPEGLAANAQGLYEHNQRHYLKLGKDVLHQVKRDPQTQQWHVEHPLSEAAYTPALLTNGVGTWRHAHEAVKNWDDLTLLTRVGPDALHIDQPAFEPILQVSEVNIEQLRHVHQDMVRPPPRLRDTLKHFNFEQEINQFTMARAEGITVSAHSPLIQLHLLGSLPEWPATTVLKILDPKQNTIMSFGAQGTEISISEEQLRKGELLQVLEQKLPANVFEALAHTDSIPDEAKPYFTPVSRLASRLSEEAAQHKQRIFTWLCEYSEKPVTPIEKQLSEIIPLLTKSQLEEISAVLDEHEQSRVLREKSLTAELRWEVDQYVRQSKTLRIREGLYLDSVSTPESLCMLLFTLEQLPGWPASHRIEIRDQRFDGNLLGRAGPANTGTLHVLTREGELYGLFSSAGVRLKEPADLFSTVEHTLSSTQRQAITLRTETASLKQAARKLSMELLANPAPTARGKPAEIKIPPRPFQPFDPLFAENMHPVMKTLRNDGIYESAPSSGRENRYYVLQNARYYQVKRNPVGWQLIDARSPFRAYKPYVGKNAQGEWGIDPNTGALFGGMNNSPPRRTSVETHFDSQHSPAQAQASPSEHSSGAGLTSMVSAEESLGLIPSESSYHTGEEATHPVPYTQQELEHMHSSSSYQHSRNYQRQYDRANNGRYPLRDVDGQSLRIRFIQAVAKSYTSETTIHKDLVLPYIKWEGYEEVARLYDEKLEVVPFSAEHQKFAQESSLIGEFTVISRRVIQKGEVLGVYGGELLPTPVATYRNDPYLMDVMAKNLPKEDAPGHPTMMTREVMLSGDNITSRINTIFEYEDGRPVRQATSGYNVETAPFDVDVQKGTAPWKRMSLCVLFASEQIEAGAELRWNYCYTEPSVRKLFGAPAASSVSSVPKP